MTQRLKMVKPAEIHKTDRKSVVQGKSVDLGGRRIIKKKNMKDETRLDITTNKKTGTESK